MRLTTRFTASQDGRHELLVGGTGDAVLTVDGEPVASWPAPDPADVMGVVARADTVAADVDLVAGRTVTVVAEFDLVPGRVQSVTLGHRPPAPPGLLDEAVALAGRADDVVLVLGDDRNASRESADRTTTHLPAGQLELLRAVAAVNPAPSSSSTRATRSTRPGPTRSAPSSSPGTPGRSLRPRWQRSCAETANPVAACR